MRWDTVDTPGGHPAWARRRAPRGAAGRRGDEGGGGAPAPPPACAQPAVPRAGRLIPPFKNRFVPAWLFCAAEDGWGRLPGDGWLSTAGAERRGGAAVPLGAASGGAGGETLWKHPRVYFLRDREANVAGCRRGDIFSSPRTKRK